MITVLCDQHVFHWELLSRYGVQNFKFHNVELLFYFINDKKTYFFSYQAQAKYYLYSIFNVWQDINASIQHPGLQWLIF